MSVVVISQPMFFPWYGLFEQIRLSNIYVHYDDVQRSQGRSFLNRVQIKTNDGVKWLTVPIDNRNSGALISETLISYEENWIQKHIKFLQNTFYRAPFKNDMLEIVENVYAKKHLSLCSLNIDAINLVTKYFNLNTNRLFSFSSALGTKSTSSQKLLDIVQYFEGSVYVTGWGAKNYIDYSLFERASVDIQYMDYQKKNYPQLFGEFNPFVSILDLIANMGTEGANYLLSNSISYKQFIPNE